MPRSVFKSCLILFILLMAPVCLTAASAQSASNYLPILQAELFNLDRSHSTLTFSVRFMGMADVEGTFERYTAAILHDEEDPTRTSITLLIDVNSIDTNSAFRDRDLKSERFFNAEAHPNILYQSKRIERTADGFLAHGDLTMRGVTKEIAVPFTSTMKRTSDPVWGNVRVGFAGSTVIARSDYGILGGSFGSFDVISDEVQIEFFLLGTIMNMEKIAFSSQEKTSIGEVLLTRLDEQGTDAALSYYQTLKANQPEGYNFAESQLNRLGYKLLQQQRLDEAVAIFRLNAEAYPESANVYSSLGEAYAALGRKEEAVANLSKSLAMDPEDTVALELLRHLH